ncbi:hypothetical protein [Corynebacterium mustelae]|uniref:hypothetical protein n=1 Tax=Corynebacterium mustelae TaxID=571915 RepID=UPI0011876554|nr:hypothetical protein [Corynebacterium mustelae]
MSHRAGHIDRNKLKNWADTRNSESEFPRLLRRLILETTPGVIQLGMPAGDGVAAGGWDGSVRVTEATPWVPKGLSVWELSVNSSPNKKADHDYSKRADTPDGTPTAKCTYIEVILRPWTDRDNWAKSKREDRVWKDVRAFGLDDIETWLEAAPITWAWLSEEHGLSPYGLRTGLTWWRDWKNQTDPKLTPEVLLAGRTGTLKDLEKKLSSSGSTTTIAGPSIEEVCAFIAAVAVSLDEQGSGQMLARLAFVDDVSTWRQLTVSPQPLILVPLTPQLVSEIPTETVHVFFVPVVSNEGSDVKLPALDASEVAESLISAGVADRDRAVELGRLARRSLTALRRNLAVKAVLHRPIWADTSPSRNFRSILLAGSWGDNEKGDRSILEELTGIDYEFFRDKITGIADDPGDPLIIRTGETWHLVSPVDAWILLMPKLTRDDMKRFETVVEIVLGEVDPAIELPQDQRWRASIEGKTRHYSGDLRGGLAQSLAILGTLGESLQLSDGASGADFANYLVRNLLQGASKDGTGKAWQSLADVLPLLAEAGPDSFLEAVSEATVGDTPLLATMFQDNVEETGIFSSGTPHTNLLWALERVSWSPDHFGRAVDLLTRLDEIDPGGRNANRPAASLSAIFCPWHPDTSVEPDRRIKVLDTLRSRYPNAAWKLECSILPERHGIHFPISTPVFQLWKPDKRSVTFAEFCKMTTVAVERCIEDAGEDSQRWSTILSHTDMLPLADRVRVVDALESMADQTQSTADFREVVWRALVDLVSHHREFPDADWALPDEELGKLDALAARYQPNTAYVRLIGLFQSWTPHIGCCRPDDYEAYERELERQRVEAVKKIEDEGGFDAIIRLARDVSLPGAVGIALAKNCLSHEDELLCWLKSDDQKLVSAAMSYFSTRYSLEGFNLVTSLLKQNDLTVDQRVRLLVVARDNLAEVWSLVDADPDLRVRYWMEFQPIVLGQDIDKIEKIADHLIHVGRHASVIHLMSRFFRIDKDGLSPQAAKLLVRALAGLSANQNPAVTAHLSSDDFQRVFDYLEVMREHLGPDCLAQLEWFFLSALGYNARVPALSESLAADPAKFVKIVCAAYRAQPSSEEEDSAEDPEGEQQCDDSLAKNAYLLLNVWDTPPGLFDGVMNAEALRVWLDRAMKLLAERGRTEIGLQKVGQVLGHTPPDPDGTWPGKVVRDLIEEKQLDHIETGLYLHIFNSRGVTSRGLEDGGDQELRLAADYRAKAQAFVDTAPRVARMFRDLAVEYEREARRHEEDAERFRRGLH